MTRTPTSCQWPVAGCRKATRRVLPCPLSTAHRRLVRRAFTLTEILVVIGITVLILAMAVPAFNFITGSRSLEAAQNNVSAMLGRARALAIYTGKPAGLAFYDDAKTRRYVMALVQFDTTPAGTTNIDLVADQDPQPLQPGTAARGMVGQGNYITPTVVMFDAQGRLVNTSYIIPQVGTNALYTATYNPASPPAGYTPLWNGNSQLALILYERSTYDNAIAGNANWLDTNGLLLVINRYNGTILDSE